VCEEEAENYRENYRKNDGDDTTRTVVPRCLRVGLAEVL
jgi:hypothetical protein